MSDLNTTPSAETDMKEFKKLQQRLNHEAIRHQFKKKVVGGLDEEDVTKYIEDLEGKFKKLEQECKKATDETYALRIKLNKELEEKDSLLTNIDELKSDLNDYMVKYAQKDMAINILNEKFTADSQALNNEIKQIQEEKNQLSHKLDESRSELEQIREYAIKFENENNILKNRIDLLEKENTQIGLLRNDNARLEEEQRELTRQINDYSIEIEQLKDHVTKYINENVAMKSKLTEMEIENLQLSEQRNDLIKQINDSRATIEELMDKSTRLENENISMKSIIESLEKDNEQIPLLKEQIIKSEEELRALNELLIESDEEMQHMKEYMAVFENEESTLKAKIAELEEENLQIAELKESNVQMVEEIKAFEELLSQSSMEFEQLKEQTANIEIENKELAAKISELENVASSKDYKINEINRVCQDLKQQLEIEKSCSDKLNMDLVIFKQKIKSLEETINEKLAELEEQKLEKERIEQELSMEKSKLLSYKVNGFKEELSELYKKIENLQEEANQSLKSSSFLYQQLTIQQNRADKAESDLAAFMQILAGAKDKFYSERNPLGDQFKQLVETKPVEESIVNEKFLDLE